MAPNRSTTNKGKKSSRKSQQSCCVRKCRIASKNTSVQIRYYPFVKGKISQHQREEWIGWVQKVNKDPQWKPKRNTYICNSHFINFEKSKVSTHPSYTPIFPFRRKFEIQPKEETLFKRYSELLKRKLPQKNGLKSVNHKRLSAIPIQPVLDEKIKEEQADNTKSTNQGAIQQYLNSLKIDVSTQVCIVDPCSNDKLGNKVVFTCHQYSDNEVYHVNTQMTSPDEAESLGKMKDKGSGTDPITCVDKCIGADFLTLAKVHVKTVQNYYQF